MLRHGVGTTGGEECLFWGRRTCRKSTTKGTEVVPVIKFHDTFFKDMVNSNSDP